MTFPPTPTRTWAAGMLVNQRITFSSLLTTLGTYVVGITNQAIAKGFTCAGSCNGVTGAMDGVNRCTTAGNFATRATIAGAAQSWIVITAVNGVQTLHTYQGASDDIARVSFSPGGLFVAAGTPANQPTATDEIVVSTGVSLIGATASNDRVFDVWIDSTANCWRAAIFRQSVPAGPMLTVELFDTSTLVGVTCSPAVMGSINIPANIGTMTSRQSTYQGNASGAQCKTSGNATTQMGGGVHVANGSFTNDSGVLLTANGSVYACRPCSLWSNSAGCVGQVGNRVDWYDSSDVSACGALTTGNSWVLINNSNAAATGGFLWPWDNSTTTCVTA
jgi:hypothetical protein